MRFQAERGNEKETFLQPFDTILKVFGLTVGCIDSLLKKMDELISS